MKQNPPRPLRRFWNEWAAPILVVVVVMGSFRSAVADWNDVPTGSMRPTILEGDRIFLNKMAYDLRVPLLGWSVCWRSDPDRGDIVIFPSPVDGRRLVKRVVGIPGDSIQWVGNRLVVNGEACVYRAVTADELVGLTDDEKTSVRFLNETVTEGPTHLIALDPNLPSPRFGPFIVPTGEYFCMGDNRNNSLDSRFFGSIQRSTIVGKATAVAASVNPENHYIPRWSRFFLSFYE